MGDNLTNIENTIANFAKTLYKVVNITIKLVKRSIYKEVPMLMKDKKKILLIINPIAGKMSTKASRFRMAELFRKNGYQVNMKSTEAKGHATQLVLDHALENDIIACCGGDGTLNEVISGVMQLGVQIPVGYIPAGTTNDFATSLNLSSRIDVAAETIMAGQKKNIDIGCFNDKRYFNYIASFGAFTGSSYSTPQSSKNIIGHLAYVLEGVKDIPSIHPYHVRVEANGEVYEDDYIFGAVSNSTSIGGIVKLDADQVDLNDGLLELILVKSPKTPLDLHKIILFLSKKESDNEMIVFLKTTEATFTMKEHTSWTIDGEYEPGGTSTKIKIVPDAITIFA